jgi:hypothetical protein
MENCIDDIKTWMLNDKLKLNDGKTDFFIIGTRQQLEKVNFDTLRIADSYVTASSEAKDLGFWLDSQMKCDPNVNSSSYFILMIESLHQISPCWDFPGVDWGPILCRKLKDTHKAFYLLYYTTTILNTLCAYILN